MRLDVNKLSSAVRLALSLGAVAAVGATGAAYAQDTGTAGNQPNPQKAQALETIVVTGSHIRRVDLETSNPVVAIDHAQIQQTGKLTLGDIVQNLPVVSGPAVNPQVNNSGGSGSSIVGLRGLGFRRTLVLVDGQRTISKDLNSIPATAVERIEVLTDGASAVYGSDAIGGVINIILRKNYQGAEFSADYGISDHNDGERKGYHFIFGQTSDKGSIMAGIDYNKTESVLSANRKFAENAVTLYGTNGAGPSAPQPPTGYVGGSSFPPYLNIQLPTAAQAAAAGLPDLRAQYGCSRVALNQGASGQNAATDYHCFGSSDKYNYATVNLIMTPQERTNLFVNGTYHLTDNIDAYMAAYHNKTSAGFQLAPALLGTLYGAVISKDNMYNPFGVDFAAGTGNDYRARLVSAGNRAARTNNAIDQTNAGFRGNLNLFDQDWTWDVGYNYGHTSTVITTLGLPNVDELNTAMGPSMLDPATGSPICVGTAGDASTKIDGCTPFNPFNLFDPQSVATLQSIASPALSNYYSIERTWHADVSGGVFNLPAGTAQLAGGVSYRKEYTHSVIDPVLLINPATGNCTLGSQCSSSLQGGYNVKEAYAELFVPILKDLPFARSLNVTVGDRYSKYSTFGSTSNTKFAVEWRPIDDLLLRGTVSKVFRAPTVGDVFGNPISDAPKLSTDPCDHITVANPACVGVPTDGSFVNTDVSLGQQIKGISSGSQYANFPLGPEQGKSFDFGFVYSPSWVQGLSFSADVWRVYLNNTITSIGAQNVLNLCFAGQTQYCSLISRNPAGSTAPGQITQIIEPTGNLGRTDVRGVDMSLRYRLPEFAFGQFNVGLDATYMGQYDMQTAPGTPANAVLHGAGHFGTFGSPLASACPSGNGGVCLFPRWRAQTFVNWQLSSWDASWRMRYIGKFRMGSPSPSQDVFPAGTCYYGDYCTIHGMYIDYGATVYNDFQVGYNIEAINTRIDVGIDNAFDKQPPFVYANNSLNANTDPSDFDLMGRYYWARVTVKF
ncbi:MAG: TonB-dependent receptor [Mizugakiibacter sp.]|uniref:TonB-dependent receptor plug domain-containing protein n=1 Tax=Mizugakiibacter sp. TaxID=1972610 RepID=UPI0031CA9DE6|nr:TonB-dependent receptor [Xanthomonadaceae bacterium]